MEPNIQTFKLSQTSSTLKLSDKHGPETRVAINHLDLWLDKALKLSPSKEIEFTFCKNTSPNNKKPPQSFS
jgi:hypothetical protein